MRTDLPQSSRTSSAIAFHGGCAGASDTRSATTPVPLTNVVTAQGVPLRAMRFQHVFQSSLLGCIEQVFALGADK
jgi:hypothetical protein